MDMLKTALRRLKRAVDSVVWTRRGDDREACVSLAEALEGRVLLSGVTIVTHGFEQSIPIISPDGFPTWVDSMAYAITQREGTPGVDVSLYRMTVTSQGGSVAVSSFTRLQGPAPNASRTGEVVIELDWAALAGLTNQTSTTTVANAVVTALLSPTAAVGLGGVLAGLPIHLIGHSRGGSLVTEIAHDLGKSGIWVDQVTTLDPRPFTGDAHSPDDNPSSGYPYWTVPLYENVVFGDNYYQRNDTAFPFGDYVRGARNSDLTGTVTGSLGPDAHSKIHTYYYGTIDTITGGNTDTGMINPSWYASPYGPRDQVGYAWSRIENGVRSNLGIGSPFSGTGYRYQIPTAQHVGQQWPNLSFLSKEEPGTLFPLGQTLHIDYKYQDADSPTDVLLYLDVDQNPYNNNFASADPAFAGADFDSQDRGYVSRSSTGNSVASMVGAELHTGGSLTPGQSYYVCARIQDGTNVRYAYLPAPIVFSAPAPVGNHNPNAPSNTSPLPGVSNQLLAPTLIASTFSDPDIGDTQSASQWQVTRSSDGATVYDSGQVGAQTYWPMPSGYLGGSTTYTWHVRYRDSHGAWSDYSTSTSFMTQPAPDTTPPLPNPSTWASAPHATGNASISMTATASTDPSGVQYYFECLGGGGHDSGWQAGNSYTDTSLSAGTTYTYHVRTRDGASAPNYGTWSDSRSATTDASAQYMPAPSLTAPADGSTKVAVSPTFYWTHVSGATSYYIMVATNPADLPTSPTVNVGGASVKINAGAATEAYTFSSDLKPATTYYWIVKAWNNATRQYGFWSSVARFTTDDQALPAPTAISPAVGDTGVATQPTFTWSAVPGATSYRIMIATNPADLPATPYTNDGGPTVVYGSSDTTAYTPPYIPLNSSTTYYWVVAGRSSMWGFWSSPASFTTRTANLSPDTPSNSSPPDGALNQLATPTLIAIAFSDPDSGDTQTASQWQVLRANDGALLYDSGQVAAQTYWVVPSGCLAAGTTFVWQVRYGDSGGAWSDYSAPTSFTTQTQASQVPGVPTLVSPSSAAALVTLTPIVTWNAVSGATNYGLYIEDTATSTLVYDNDYVGNVTSLNLPAGTLAWGKSYTWNMRASNSAGFGSYSSAWSFTTVQAPAYDLSWAKLVATPAIVLAGGLLTATRSYNVSAAAVSPDFRIEYRLSTNQIWGDGDDILIAQYETINQASGKSIGTHSGTFNLAVPASVKPGSYYLLAKLDSMNTVSESNEANNVIVGSRISVIPPVNDNFAQRLTLSGASATMSYTNVNATPEAGEPYHAGYAGGHSVWWTWLAPDSGRTTIDTTGSGFATLLGVYVGSKVSALSTVGSSKGGSVVFNAVRGQAYQIAVDGYNGAAGSIKLNVKLTAGVLDDKQAVYSPAASWLEMNGSYQGKMHYSARGTGANTATWTFSRVLSGTYRVSANWLGLSTVATNAPYSIYDGGKLLKTVTVNQKLKPAGTSFDGVIWQSLGSFKITSGTLSIKLSNYANGYVLADAVRIERIAAAAQKVVAPAPATAAAPKRALLPASAAQWPFATTSLANVLRGAKDDILI